MNQLRIVYRIFCKLEEWLVSLFIAGVTALVLAAAIGRSVGFPLNWAREISLLLTAWIVFLGADLALRTVGFIRVDIVFKHLPRKVQWGLYYLFNLAALALLGVIAVYGLLLTMDNSERLYQTIGISYAWAAASAPVGCILLMITLIQKMITGRNDESVLTEGQEAI